MNPSKITTTVGLNIGKIELSGIRLNFWDLGGQEELQSLWDKKFINGIELSLQQPVKKSFFKVPLASLFFQSCWKDVVELSPDLQSFENPPAGISKTQFGQYPDCPLLKKQYPVEEMFMTQAVKCFTKVQENASCCGPFFSCIKDSFYQVSYGRDGGLAFSKAAHTLDVQCTPCKHDVPKLEETCQCVEVSVISTPCIAWHGGNKIGLIFGVPCHLPPCHPASVWTRPAPRAESGVSFEYYAESHALIYIVDSSDRERIPDSKETFEYYSDDNQESNVELNSTDVNGTVTDITGTSFISTNAKDNDLGWEMFE
ncbi:ADP-ribosylation factor protein 1, partial [Homalodisca vitripennis]